MGCGPSVLRCLTTGRSHLSLMFALAIWTLEKESGIVLGAVLYSIVGVREAISRPEIVSKELILSALIC